MNQKPLQRFIVNTNVYFTAVICVAFLCLARARDKWQWHRKLTNPLEETCPSRLLLDKTIYKKKNNCVALSRII